MWALSSLLVRREKAAAGSRALARLPSRRWGQAGPLRRSASSPTGSRVPDSSTSRGRGARSCSSVLYQNYIKRSTTVVHDGEPE